MIEAHGHKFETAAAAEARIAEINEVNLQIGISDGRVTEIMCITEALQAAGCEMTPAECARFEAQEGIAPIRHIRATPTLGPLTMQYIIEAQQDLASIKRTGYDDGKWRYLKVTTPEGRTTAREYRTQKGFLTAYIREASKGSDILIAE